jgi:hypothetical protein
MMDTAGDTVAAHAPRMQNAGPHLPAASLLRTVQAAPVEE